MAKTINTRIKQKYDKESNWATVESSYIPYNGELVVYSFDTDEPPEVKIGDGESVLEDLPFIYEADVPIPDPVLVGTYTYNGQGITPQFDVDLEKVNANIPTKINAGTYTKENGGAASFTPKTGYMWQDGTKTTKYIEWTINKADLTITLNSNVYYLTPGGSVDSIPGAIDPDTPACDLIFSIAPAGIITSMAYSITLNATTSGILDYTGEHGLIPYEDTDQFYISITGSKGGSTSVTLSYRGDTNINYAVSNSATVVNNVSPSASDLKSSTWEQISIIAEKGQASNYWEIGDYKQIENSIMPNACAFIVDMYSSQGIMFEINANTSVDTSSTGTRYAFTKNYNNSAQWTQTAGHGYYDYSDGFYMCSDFDTAEGYTYTWGAATSDSMFYYNDPLWYDLNSIYNAMGTSIKPYIKPVIEQFIDQEGSWPNNYMSSCTSYVTIATPFQLGFTGSNIDNTGSYCSWNKQFEFYLNGNIKQKRGCYVQNGNYQTVSGYTNVEYWLRPLNYDYGYPYVNTSGELLTTSAAAGPDGTKSRGICPIFRMGPNT